MSRYQRFIFKSYLFDSDTKTLRCTYAYDNELEFNETYKFDFDFAKHASYGLDRACQLLFFMAGISYYKAYMAPKIEVKAGKIDQPLADFLGKTYQKGLGEFFYVNKLNPYTKIVFPVNSDVVHAVDTGSGDGQLIGLGGGKDSLVSVETLRGQSHVATWSANHRSQLEPLVKRIGLPHFWVEREWDQQLLELSGQDAYNGHVPISAILSCTGLVAAILSGFRDIVVSNENSASEPTLHYQGLDINHQYSKSLEYEQDFQVCLSRVFGTSQRYYSLLRPFSEIRIAEFFAKTGFEKYKDVFSSCNRAYTHGQNHMFWCGKCPKCAFVFLALTPFLERELVESLWGGKNLLLDSKLEPTYRQLLGMESDKPMECVGEIKESRAAMRMAQKKYRELKKYDFGLSADYNYQDLSAHSMPIELYEKIAILKS